MNQAITPVNVPQSDVSIPVRLDAEALIAKAIDKKASKEILALLMRLRDQIESEVIQERLLNDLSRAQGEGDHHAEADLLIKLVGRKSIRASRTTYKSHLHYLFSHIVISSFGCWLWTGCKDSGGYGNLGNQGIKGIKENKAHRYAWRLLIGPIPKGQCVLHRCDVRCCINPEHLFLGSQAENVQDCVLKKRHGWRTGHGGSAHPMAKLSREQVHEMRALRHQGLSYAKIAEQFSISTMTAFRAITKRSWCNE